MIHSTGTSILRITSRVPALLLPLALALALAPTGSGFTIATAVAAALVGTALAPSAAQLAADRAGSRNVLLGGAVLHVLLLVLLVSAAEHFLSQQLGSSAVVTYWTMVGFALLAGLTTPAAAVFLRQPAASGQHGISEDSKVPGTHTETGPAQVAMAEAQADEVALLSAAVIISLHGFGAGPSAALITSAVLTAVVLPILALSLAPTRSTEAARLRVPAPVPGAETAQAEALQTWTDRRSRVSDAGPTGGSSGDSRHGLYRLYAPVMLCFGLILGGLWITALDAGLALGRPAFFGLPLAGATLAAIVWLRLRRGSRLPLQRRRRLLGTVLVSAGVVLFLAAVFLPSPGWGMGLTTFTAAVLGWWQSEGLAQLYGEALRTRSQATARTLTVLGFALLIGLLIGLTVAGVVSHEWGRGWGAALVVLGATAVAVQVRTSLRH